MLCGSIVRGKPRFSSYYFASFYQDKTARLVNHFKGLKGSKENTYNLIADVFEGLNLVTLQLGYLLFLGIEEAE